MDIVGRIFPKKGPELLEVQEVPKDVPVVSDGLTNPGGDPLAAAYAKAGLNRQDTIAKIAKDKVAENAKAAESKVKLEKQNNQKALQSKIEEGMRQGQDKWTTYQDAIKTPDLGYVTAAQAKLYIGGILVDECYDVQYQYKEYKEPVYGYNDKHWGAVLKGNVIVSGTFTINYKHDAYLVKLLAKVAEDRKGSQNTKVRDAYRKKVEMDNMVNNYKAKLSDYKTLFNNISLMKRDVKEIDLQLKAATEKDKLLKGEGNPDTLIDQDFKAKNAALKKSRETFLAGLDAEDKEKVVQGQAAFIAATDNYQAKLAENKAKLTAAEDNWNNKKKWAESLKKEIASLEAQLQALKNDKGLTPAKSIAEKEAALASSLEQLAMVNGQINDAAIAVNDIRKSNVETLAPASESVADAADDNQTKDYIKFGLQEAKLRASQNKAKADAAKTKKSVEAELSAIKARKDMYDKAITEAEKTLKDLLNGKDKQPGIASLRDKINELNDTIAKLAGDAEYAIANRDARAEDFGTWEGPTFVLFIEYNNTIHKVLEDCTLTGHGHVVAQGGEVIKEYYSFISRRIR